MTKPPKKSETLEIRIPHGTKQALMARSRAEGRPASEVVRGFIDAYLAEAACLPTPTAWERNMTKLRACSRPTMALLATLAAVGGVSLAVSPATALPDLEAAFRQLDTDGNGVLSADEFGSGRMIRKLGPGGASAGAAANEVPALPAPSGAVFVMRAAPTTSGSRPVVLAVPLPGSGQVGGSPAGPVKVGAARFASIDSDHYGRLSLAEFEAHHRGLVDRAFAAADANKDGFLDAAEVAGVNRGEGEAPAVIAAFDRDGDGRMSRAEFMTPRP